MKVLLITPKIMEHNGGIAVWTDAFLHGAEKHGIDCDIVNTKTIGRRAKNLTARTSLWDEMRRTLSIMRQLRRLTRDKGAYDVAHLNTSIGTFGIVRDYYCAKQLKKKKIPIVLHFHCNIEFWIKNKTVHRYLSKILQIADKCLVLNKQSQEYLKAEFSVDSDIVPNFIADDLVVEKKAINENMEKVFFAGRVTPEKGMNEILKAATALPDITFELAGEISEQAQTINFPENVRLLGRISRSESLSKMDGADIFLFPTYSEGFSISLLESMARGLPAVTTITGANAAMMADGAGIAVPVGDVNALIDAVNLLKALDKRAAISKCAIDKTRRLYTESAFFEYIVPMYKGLMNKGSKM